MYLLTCNQYLVTKNSPEPGSHSVNESVEAFAWDGELPDGLAMLLDYQRAYKKAYYTDLGNRGKIVEFRLLSVQKLDYDIATMQRHLSALGVTVLTQGYVDQVGQ
jgi:hypothetical protein